MGRTFTIGVHLLWPRRAFDSQHSPQEIISFLVVVVVVQHAAHEGDTHHVVRLFD